MRKYAPAQSLTCLHTSSAVQGLHGDHAGLYVLGTKVIAVNGTFVGFILSEWLDMLPA